MTNVRRGGPKRTGSVERAGEWPSGKPRWRGRVRLGDGTKSNYFDVPEAMTDPQARAWVAGIQADEDAQGLLLAAKREKAQTSGRAATPTEKSEDPGAWFDAWIASKAARGQTSTADRRAHYVHHIKPVLSTHVRSWDAADLRRLVASLDEKIGSGRLAAKSARNVWGTATKMCADAMRSKVEALRCRADNPASDVEGPDRGDDRSKQFLYPSELVRVLGCEDIPLRWRRAIALAVYLFPRAGELRALRWEDVDLEHGTVHIHRSFERRSRTVKGTKTKTARRFAFDGAVRPLLEAMHAEAGGEGTVCPIPNRMADRLRDWLRRAGVDRSEFLDAGSATTKPLGWHDLRATGLTWMAVRGEEPLKIMQRAGHEDFATTQIYIRTAEAVRGLFGEVFPVLPKAILHAPPSLGHRVGQVVRQVCGKFERDTGFEEYPIANPRRITSLHAPNMSATSI